MLCLCDDVERESCWSLRVFEVVKFRAVGMLSELCLLRLFQFGNFYLQGNICSPLPFF